MLITKSLIKAIVLPKEQKISNPAKITFLSSKIGLRPLVPAVSQKKTGSFLPQKEEAFGKQHMIQNKKQVSFQDMILIQNSLELNLHFLLL